MIVAVARPAAHAHGGSRSTCGPATLETEGERKGIEKNGGRSSPFEGLI